MITGFAGEGISAWASGWAWNLPECSPETMQSPLFIFPRPSSTEIQRMPNNAPVCTRRALALEIPRNPEPEFLPEALARG